MKHILEAGTDGACIAVFDAWALPVEFDASAAHDPRQAAEDAQQAGCCFFSDTGGDGSHVLHVYVDEDVPPALLGQATSVGRHDAFQLPSGRLFFTGAEYLCRDELLEPAATVSEQRAELPCGSYAARFYQVESTNDESRRIDAALGRSGRGLLAALPVLVSTVLLAFIAAAFLFFNGGASRSFALALLLATSAAAGAFLLERMPAYRSALRQRTSLRQEHCPDFILVLTTPSLRPS